MNCSILKMGFVTRQKCTRSCDLPTFFFKIQSYICICRHRMILHTFDTFVSLFSSNHLILNLKHQKKDKNDKRERNMDVFTVGCTQCLVLQLYNFDFITLYYEIAHVGDIAICNHSPMIHLR